MFLQSFEIRHIDLQADMKTTIIIFLLLSTGLTHCFGQERKIVGTDLAALLCKGQAMIFGGYALGQNWSAEAEVSLNIKYLSDILSDLEESHWKELYGYESPEVKLKEDFAQCAVSFCFWPRSCHDGAMLSIGGEIRDRKGPDLTVGIGYYCKIWKGLRIGVIYRTRMLENINNGKLSLEGININLGYAF